jgi:hypothetical protein
MLYGIVGPLLAAAAGYWVLERAAGHKGQLHRVGQVVGATIIVVSLLSVAAAIWSCSGGAGWAGGKGAWKDGGMCPFTRGR